MVSLLQEEVFLLLLLQLSEQRLNLILLHLDIGLKRLKLGVETLELVPQLLVSLVCGFR